MTRSLKLFLLSSIMLLCGVIAGPLYGQSRTVNGVVQDDNGDPLYGAFVVQQGTTNGVSTDMDGKFSSHPAEHTCKRHPLPETGRKA